MIMKKLTVVLALVCCASPAAAQTSVSAVLGADLVRAMESTTNGATYPDADREAISWGLRLGTGLGDRWGVELEFNRPGKMDTRNGPMIYAAGQGDVSAAVVAALGAVNPAALIYPVPDIRTSLRTTTWNTSAWARRPLGARADLVVLGGVGFSRAVQTSDVSYTFSPMPLANLAIRPTTYRTRTIGYGVGPLVGAEARIRMTDHLELVPGIRIQSPGNDLTDGLILRPAVALGWTF